MNSKTVIAATQDLERVGLIRVERRRNGESNVYRLPVSVPETGTVTERGRDQNRSKNRNGGVPKTGTEALQKREQNQTDPVNQKGAASPPQDGDGFELTAPAKRDGGCGRLVGLWISLYPEAVGRTFPTSGRGQLAGTLKAMLKATPVDDLAASIHRWFGRQRDDYGVALFKCKVEGGNDELIRRAGGQADDDPMGQYNARLLTKEASG